MKIHPLITGTHVAQKTAQGTLLPAHTSSVTLLQHDDHHILVDTGGRGMMHHLKLQLKEFGLNASDITMIILTHLHLDHAYNIGHFSNARVLAWKHEWRRNETLRLDKMDGFQPCPRVTILQTPGHAEEHIAVAVEQDDGTCTVLAGDALNEEYALTKQIAGFTYDEALYRQNAERLLRIADTIIPGHGRIFHP